MENLNAPIPTQGPFAVHIHPVRVCNLSCDFCLFHSKKLHPDSAAAKWRDAAQQGRPYMETSMFQRFVDSIDKLGGLWSVIFAGFGEPMMHPELPEMISYVKKRSQKREVEVVTNGILLGERKKELIESGPDILNISINAWDEDLYRRLVPDAKKEDFSGLVRTVGDMARDNNLRIHFSSVVTRHNLDVRAFREFAEDLGVRKVRFLPLVKTENLSDGVFNEDLSISPLQFSEFFELVKKESSRGKVEIEILADLNEYGCIDTMQYYRSNPCYIGYIFCMLNTNGQIISCCPGMRILGNIYESSFEEIWRGSEYQDFRREGLEITSNHYPWNCQCNECSNVDLNKIAGNILPPELWERLK